MSEEKYGFVYIWRDRKKNRYYIGCHWGAVDDGYICSSNWMRKAYRRRPHDFRRRILISGIKDRAQMYVEERNVFSKIKLEELKIRYYNLRLNTTMDPWHADEEKRKTIGQKISAAKKGKSTGPCSPEKAKKISEAKLAKKRKMSDETKAKMIASKIGRPLSEEHRQNISKGMLKGEEKKVPERLSEEDLHAVRMVSQEKATAALTGSKRYNNGTQEISSKEHPGEGWVVGRLPRTKEYINNHTKACSEKRKGTFVVNNGIKNMYLKFGEEIPVGYKAGMAPRKR